MKNVKKGSIYTKSILVRKIHVDFKHVDNYLKEGNGMASPGVDELKWIKPVYPGDILSVRIVVKNTRISKSRPNIAIIKTFCEIINQDKLTVMTLITNSFAPLRN